MKSIEVVRALAAKGCGGAVIYAAGFAETGNTELQRKLLEAANGMPLMGPNCYGFVNTLSRAALWPDETVHHKNGDKRDNRIENLEVTSHQAHSEHHNQKHAKTSTCKVCGATFTPMSSFLTLPLTGTQRE